MNWLSTTQALRVSFKIVNFFFIELNLMLFLQSITGLRQLNKVILRVEEIH